MTFSQKWQAVHWLIVTGLICAFLAPGAFATPPELSKDKRQMLLGLYDQGIQATMSLDQIGRRDSHLTDLATQQLDFIGDIEFAERIHALMGQSLYGLEVRARVARAKAQAGRCDEARSELNRIYNAGLKTDLVKNRPHHRAPIAFKAMIEAYAYCGDVDHALDLIQTHRPGPLKVNQYLGHALATTAAIRFFQGDRPTAQTLIDDALKVAEPTRDETHRSMAMASIADSLIDAGHYDSALAIALDIKQTAHEAGFLALKFHEKKNSVLIRLACRYASIGDLQAADRVLANQHIVSGKNYPPCLVRAYIKSILERDHATALKKLGVLDRSLRRGDHRQDRLLIAQAYSALEAADKARSIILQVLEDELSDYTRDIADHGKPSPGTKGRIDHMLLSYVVAVGFDHQLKALLEKPPLSHFRPNDLSHTWGAIIGEARLQGNADRVQWVTAKLGPKATPQSLIWQTFRYYLEIKDFSKAEAIIPMMRASDRPGAFMRLVRAYLGVTNEYFMNQRNSF